MKMTLDYEYCLKCDTRVLGVAGEVNGRTITFNGLEVSGATGYTVKFGLPDKTSFEGTITNGSYTIPATPVLRAGRVWVQVIASNGSSMIRKSQPLAMLVVDSIDYIPHDGEITPSIGEIIYNLEGVALPNAVGHMGLDNSLFSMMQSPESEETSSEETDTEETAEQEG